MVRALATNALGLRLEPYGAFNFLIEFEGLLAGGFAEASGLQVEIETEDYREGGQNGFKHKLPGPAHYPQNLVLKRGLTDVDSLWAWQQDVAKGRIKRRNGTIYLLDGSGLPATWWDVLGAYPVKWAGPELRAGGSEVAFETLELAHRGITQPAGSRLRKGLSAAKSLGRKLSS